MWRNCQNITETSFGGRWLESFHGIHTVVFLRPVPRGDLEEEVAVSDEEVESGSTSDEEEEQEDPHDYCKGLEKYLDNI